MSLSSNALNEAMIKTSIMSEGGGYGNVTTGSSVYERSRKLGGVGTTSLARSDFNIRPEVEFQSSAEYFLKVGVASGKLRHRVQQGREAAKRQDERRQRRLQHRHMQQKFV